MKNKLILVITCLFSLYFLAFIFKLSDDIQREDIILESSPNVSVVTDTIKTQVLTSPDDLAPEKWAAANVQSGDWKNVKLPAHKAVQEPQFKEGNFIYYRISIPKTETEKFLHLKGELDLALYSIIISKMEIFVNGKYLRTDSPNSLIESVTNIPVVAGEDNLVAIKGFIKKGDRGVEHRNNILLGKSGELRVLYLSTYTGSTVFPLIFILCKGSVLFLFALIYLQLNVGKFFEKSLLFSLFAVSEDFLTSEILSTVLTLQSRAYLHDFVNIGSNIMLFLFLSDVIGDRKNKKTFYIVASIFSVISLLMISEVLHASKIFNFGFYLKFWNLVSAGILAYFLPRVLKQDKILFFAMIASAILTIWSSVFAVNVGMNFEMYGNLLLFFMVAYQSFALFRQEQISLQAKEVQLLEQEKDVAIGKTANILAHDVRRPLEQMKLILDKVSKGEISAEFLKTAQRDVDFSITSVNNQINDIMNYSKTRSAELSDISFYGVLSGSLKQVMTINKGINLKIDLSLNAERKVLGDESRLAGALTNIISNAVEAIRDIGKKNSGLIKISTEVFQDKFIAKIFNDGPEIPSNILTEIWKPLFTSGKSKGTGLGLASVKKTIEDQNGSIYVRNVPGGVEFVLELKISNQSDLPSGYDLKTNSGEYTYDLKPVTVNQKRPLRIFLLDDDQQVYEYFSFLIQNLNFEVELTYVTHVQSGRDVVRNKRFDLYILDYDLGNDQSGLDFYKENLSFLSSEVIIHTNREKAVVSNERCGHAKKPMSFEELSSHCESAWNSRKKILLADDSDLTLMAWEMFHGSHNVVLVSSPEATLQYLQSNPSVDLCVVDYYFDNSPMKGDELASKIKALNSNLKVVIASNSEHSFPDLQSIPKDHFEVRSLN